jgi:hypothetical protein
MANECSICTHQDREAIDEGLASGVPYSKLVAAHGITKSALSRHRQRHLSPALARLQAQARPLEEQYRSSFSRIEDLYTRASRILDLAEGRGAASTSLAAIRELRQIVELLARVTGELDERPVVNLIASPDWLALRGALLEELGAYPEVRARVVRRLLEVEGREVAG